MMRLLMKMERVAGIAFSIPLDFYGSPLFTPRIRIKETNPGGMIKRNLKKEDRKMKRVKEQSRK